MEEDLHDCVLLKTKVGCTILQYFRRVLCDYEFSIYCFRICIIVLRGVLYRVEDTAFISILHCPLHMGDTCETRFFS